MPWVIILTYRNTGKCGVGGANKLMERKKEAGEVKRQVL